MTPARAALLALADAREAVAKADLRAARLRAKADRAEAEALRAIASDSEQASPFYTVREAARKFRGSRERVLRLTRGLPCRKEFSKTDIRFERAGFDRWLSGARPREVKRAS